MSQLSPLAKRLQMERERRFVGRKRELELFQLFLASNPPSFSVLHIFGPGGVGKTTLLRQFVRLCQQVQRPSFYLDARNLDASPASFLSTLGVLTGLELTATSLEKLAEKLPNCVILLDTYETLTPLDDWLREVFLPQLPENTLMVIASRQPPAAPWRTDPGWQGLIYPLSLPNLSPEESKTYLNQREIPVTSHQSVLDFTHGHPLALSLVADLFAQGQVQEFDFCPEAAPDVVKLLLEKFLQDIPTPDRRLALEACALVRLMAEDLLAVMLDLPDGYELFNWLRGLSFIESGRQGLFPHDLVREVLIADLRWRNRDWYAELHRRARLYYTARLQQTQGQEQHPILLDYIFLHRDCPAIRPHFIWQEHSSLLTAQFRETDQKELWRMVAQQEGEESAEIAAHWWQRQPQGTLVFRDAGQEIVGFVLTVALHLASPEDLRLDPAVWAAWQHLQNHAPLRQREGAICFRFWMAKDTYQAVSPVQSLIFINFVQYHRVTPGLAYTFFTCADPDFWAAMFAYADLVRLPGADFEVGGRRYGVYGHDWRVVSPTAWQELLAQREIAAAEPVMASPMAREPLLVLSQSAFKEAVQEALRNYTRPDVLQNNPLLRSRLVVAQVAAGGTQTQRVAVLVASLKEVVESLRSFPRDEKLYRVLYRTYLQPASTQEKAAELLDLPFSTYRRHLKAGVARVAEILWQREIQ